MTQRQTTQSHKILPIRLLMGGLAVGLAIAIGIGIFKFDKLKNDIPQSLQAHSIPIIRAIHRSPASTLGLNSSVPSKPENTESQVSPRRISIDRRTAEASIQKVREYKERAARQNQNIPESRKLKFDGREFLWRPDLIAVPSKDYQGNPGEVAGRFTHFLFVKRTDIASSEIVIDNPSELPVTENPDNHRLGLITGTFIIKFNPETELDAIASKHGMRVTNSVPHLHLAFLESKPRIDLRTQLLELQNDPQISSAELEILDSQVTPK